MTYHLTMFNYSEEKAAVLGSGPTPEDAQQDAIDNFTAFACDISGAQVWSGTGRVPEWTILTTDQLNSVNAPRPTK